MVAIEQLFAGRLRSLPPEGQQTGIFKQPVEKAQIGPEGMLEDHQADRRYHGGPEKALHQYALDSYAIMLETYPQLSGEAVPGSMGENISSAALNESSVCIGDIYRMGRVLLQVSQPRTPCWKISHRFGIESLSKFVEERGIAGWYYRVLETGCLYRGDAIELLERPNADVSIEFFLQTRGQHRPIPEALDKLIRSRGLSPEWQQKLEKRRDFLQRLKG